MWVCWAPTQNQHILTGASLGPCSWAGRLLKMYIFLNWFLAVLGLHCCVSCLWLQQAGDTLWALLHELLTVEASRFTARGPDPRLNKLGCTDDLVSPHHVGPSRPRDQTPGPPASAAEEAGSFEQLAKIACLNIIFQGAWSKCFLQGRGWGWRGLGTRQMLPFAIHWEYTLQARYRHRAGKVSIDKGVARKTARWVTFAIVHWALFLSNSSIGAGGAR